MTLLRACHVSSRCWRQSRSRSFKRVRTLQAQYQVVPCNIGYSSSSISQTTMYLLRAADRYAYRLWKHYLFCRDCLERRDIYILLAFALLCRRRPVSPHRRSPCRSRPTRKAGTGTRPIRNSIRSVWRRSIQRDRWRAFHDYVLQHLDTSCQAGCA